MEQLRSDFAEHVDFVKVYVSEAHPIDEWQVYTTADINYRQPQTLCERLAAAKLYMKDQPSGMPLVLDAMSNDAERGFAAHPERLYVLLPDGTVGYKGDTGPFGYKPGELRAWLEQHCASMSRGGHAAAAQQQRQRQLAAAIGIAIVAVALWMRPRNR